MTIRGLANGGGVQVFETDGEGVRVERAIWRGTYEELAEIVQRESRLTSGLRELAEKWEAQALYLANRHGSLHATVILMQKCASELLALIPEATQKVSDKKSVSK